MNNDFVEAMWRLVREQTRKWCPALPDEDLEQIAAFLLKGCPTDELLAAMLQQGSADPA